MKKLNWTHLIGKTIFSSGVIGIIIAIFFTTFTWIVKVQINESLQNIFSSLESVLATSKEGLVLINGSLQHAYESLETIESAVDGLESSIINLIPITDNTAEVIGNDLINIIVDAQSSLNSASAGSKIVDDTLKILATIPLLGLDFQPDIPLHTSLSILSSDLNDLPDNLLVIQSNIFQTSDSLDKLATSLLSLSNDLSEFKNEIENSRIVIANYELVFNDLEQSLITIRNSTSLWLTGISVLISILMIWLLLSQITPLFLAHDILVGKSQYVNVHDILKEENNNNQMYNKGD